MLVMLRTDWPSDTFRRADLVFERGVPADVDDATAKRLADDLGKSLVLINPTNAKADHEATAEAAADLDAFLKKTAANAAVNAAASPAEQPSAAETTTTTEAAPAAEPPPKRKR